MTSRHILNACPKAVEYSYDEIKTTRLLNMPGIYHLCCGNEVVYIGKSSNARSRIITHARNFVFDKVVFIPYFNAKDAYEDKYILEDVESIGIRIARPILNCAMTRCSSRPRKGAKKTIRDVLKMAEDTESCQWKKYYLQGCEPFGVTIVGKYKKEHRFNYKILFALYNEISLGGVA